MKHYFFVVMASCVLGGIMNASCSQDIPAEEDASILFHVKSQQYVVSGTSRTIIDGTEDLLEQRPPIYVSDENSTSNINSAKVDFLSAGIWRSDNLKWNSSLTYVFYGYVSSPAPASETGNTDGSGPYISNSQNGRSVTITQPENYSEDSTHWADYLLSYRVTANGANRPVVNLQFERVTAGVELYITKGMNMPEAKVTRISFKGVKRKTRMILNHHATKEDIPGATGMRNLWNNSTDTESSSIVSYTLDDEEGIDVSPFDEKKGKYDVSYRFMRFLTVPQILHAENTLEISYKVLENNSWRSYEVEFELDNYTPSEWTIGHKVRYYLNIDTSMELQAVVEKWNTLNVIEGTFIPD